MEEGKAKELAHKTLARGRRATRFKGRQCELRCVCCPSRFSSAVSHSRHGRTYLRERCQSLNLSEGMSDLGV